MLIDEIFTIFTLNTNLYFFLIIMFQLKFEHEIFKLIIEWDFVDYDNWNEIFKLIRLISTIEII